MLMEAMLGRAFISRNMPVSGCTGTPMRLCTKRTARDSLPPAREVARAVAEVGCWCYHDRVVFFGQIPSRTDCIHQFVWKVLFVTESRDRKTVVGSETSSWGYGYGI